MPCFGIMFHNSHQRTTYMNLKRNDQCWCNSGKKYKKCHLFREKQEKMKIYDMARDLKNSYTKDKCYAPERYLVKCSDTIIKAHTVSKSSNLKPIASDGHVYGFKSDLNALIKTHGKFNVTKIGINNSSIFTGFCSKHDKELFEALDEKFKFTDEQIFLNLYRTLTRELYVKEKNALFQATTAKEYDKGMNVSAQVGFQDFRSYMHIGNETAHRDLKIVKTVLDEKLINQDYSNIKYYAIIINKIPDIVSTCVWAASRDFKNTKLIDITDLSKNFNSMCVSTFPYSEKGIILFSWLDDIESPECYSFIKSLSNLSNKDKIKAFINWLFSANENIFLAPKWWENLGIVKKTLLVDIFNSTMTKEINLSNYHHIDVVDWKIEDIKTNISEL